MQLSNAQQAAPCAPQLPLGIFGNCFIYRRLFIANCVKGLFTLLSAMETIYSLSKQLLNNLFQNHAKIFSIFNQLPILLYL